MGRSLRADLDRHGLGGVFFLQGDDAFGREEALRHLIDAHMDPAVRDFNLDALRGSAVDVDTLASILATPPMMAEWRVVVIRDAEPLAMSSRARSLILDTAAAPPPGSSGSNSTRSTSATAIARSTASSLRPRPGVSRRL